jgi:hypothetical protein
MSLEPARGGRRYSQRSERALTYRGLEVAQCKTLRALEHDCATGTYIVVYNSCCCRRTVPRTPPYSSTNYLGTVRTTWIQSAFLRASKLTMPIANRFVLCRHTVIDSWEVVNDNSRLTLAAKQHFPGYSAAVIGLFGCLRVFLCRRSPCKPLKCCGYSASPLSALQFVCSLRGYIVLHRGWLFLCRLHDAKLALLINLWMPKMSHSRVFVLVRIRYV